MYINPEHFQAFYLLILRHQQLLIQQETFSQTELMVSAKVSHYQENIQQEMNFQTRIVVQVDQGNNKMIGPPSFLPIHLFQDNCSLGLYPHNILIHRISIIEVIVWFFCKLSLQHDFPYTLHLLLFLMIYQTNVSVFVHFLQTISLEMQQHQQQHQLLFQLYYINHFQQLLILFQLLQILHVSIDQLPIILQQNQQAFIYIFILLVRCMEHYILHIKILLDLQPNLSFMGLVFQILLFNFMDLYSVIDSIQQFLLDQITFDMTLPKEKNLLFPKDCIILRLNDWCQFFIEVHWKKFIISLDSRHMIGEIYRLTPYIDDHINVFYIIQIPHRHFKNIITLELGFLLDIEQLDQITTAPFLIYNSELHNLHHRVFHLRGLGNQTFSLIQQLLKWQKNLQVEKRKVFQITAQL